MKMKHSYLSSLVFSTSIAIVFWLIFLPGFFSADSIGVLNMVKGDELNSAHTAPYALYVKALSFSGSIPGIVTLFNVLALVFATTTFIWELNYEPKIKFISSLVISITPLIWAMGITLWHDIPFTAGLLMFIVSISRRNMGKSWLIYSLIGGVLLSFRPNWIPLILAFAVLALFVKSLRSRKVFLSIVTTFTVASISFFGSSILIKEPAIQVHFAQEWIRNDLSCFAAKNEERFSKELTPLIGSVDEWKSIKSCTFLNDAKLSEETLSESYEKAIPTWIELVIMDPLFILRTHLERNAYLVPIPFFGIPEPPFLHTTIEVESPDLQWVNPELVEQVRPVARVWNLFRGFFAFAGLWVLLAFFIAVRRKGNLEIAAVTMSTSLLLTLFVFAPIPDGRYALPALVIGQSMTFLHLLGHGKGFLNRWKRSLLSGVESKVTKK